MNKTLIIHPEELSEKWVNRAKAAGCTTLALHPVGGPSATESLTALTKLFEDENFLRKLDYVKSMGLNLEYQMHAARFLLPEKFFAQNPNLFRMNKDGVRTTDRNFCTSEERALEIMAENALKLSEMLYGSGHKFYFWKDDGDDGKCRCEKCREISASDQQLRFLNAIIEKLRTVFPDAKLAYLAYCDTSDVPQTQKPHEGIFLQYAPFKRDFSKGAAAMPSDEKERISKLLDFFGKEDAEVLEYWYDNSMFSNWKKPPRKFIPDNETIKNDILFYREFGFESISSFACFLGEDYEALYGEPDVSAFGG